MNLPTPEQLVLFRQVIREVREHERDYLEAAEWFGGEFSLAAIDARAEAARHPLERAMREDAARTGMVLRERSDTSGYMERLLRAVEELVRHDDSALPRLDRVRFDCRVLLVADLMADPDFVEHAPTLAAKLQMDRAHWPTAKALVEGGDEELELDRWWARAQVFETGGGVYQPFEPLVRRAMERAGAALPPMDALPATAVKTPAPAPGFLAVGTLDPEPARLEEEHADSARFVLRGEVWEVAYAGKATQLKDRKGMHHLRELLSRPRVPISAEELAVAPEHLAALRVRRQKLVERPEVMALLKELRDLRNEQEDAVANGDLGRQDHLASELARVQQSLEDVQGAQGRSRMFADEGERLRKRVGAALALAIQSIDGSLPGLAEHLRDSIRDPFGAAPCYSPNPLITWVTML